MFRGLLNLSGKKETPHQGMAMLPSTEPYPPDGLWDVDLSYDSTQGCATIDEQADIPACSEQSRVFEQDVTSCYCCLTNCCRQ